MSTTVGERRWRWRTVSLATVLTLAACTPEQVALVFAVTHKHAHVLSGEQLERLRWCESRHDYAAISPSGRYRGAYQFDRRTWDGVAQRHYPWLVGHDPASVDWWWQDAMARALWSERGAQPWPTCGRRV
jgi:hypothetical protein